MRGLLYTRCGTRKKELYQFEVSKNDFADILDLVEENAKSRKLLKKECDRVEIVDIETV